MATVFKDCELQGHIFIFMWHIDSVNWSQSARLLAMGTRESWIFFCKNLGAGWRGLAFIFFLSFTGVGPFFFFFSQWLIWSWVNFFRWYCLSSSYHSVLFQVLLFLYRILSSLTPFCLLCLSFSLHLLLSHCCSLCCFLSLSRSLSLILSLSFSPLYLFLFLHLCTPSFFTIFPNSSDEL